MRERRLSASSPVPVRIDDLTQFRQPELPNVEPEQASAPAPPSSWAPVKAQTFDPSLSVPIGRKNLSQLHQPELPVAEPSQVPAPPSSGAPTQAQAFDPYLPVPVRTDNGGQFRQPELPLAEPARAPASPSSQAPMQAQAFEPSLSVPVRTDNGGQFRQPELPLAEPARAPASPSSQAPMQAQAFEPSLSVPIERNNLSQLHQPELPVAEPAQAPAPPSSGAPMQAQAFDPYLPVPVRTDNLSQFRQTELLPLAIPTQALALPSSLAPASSQAPVQAQVFNPSLLVPARMDDLSDFSQPEPPTVVPAQALAPPSTQASERAQVSCPPSCVPEHVRYKNRLQEYTQKIMVHFPIYNTINEGSQHAPRYRSTVFVDGKSFTSPNTFPQKKEAEQNVAQIALELLSQKMEDEACPLIHEDTIFCKSILNEYAAKMNLEMPNYRTIQPQGAVPVFASSLVFNGVTYTGDVGKSKKEAEQLAARAAIQSLYDDSKSKIVLLKTIKSKWKLYAAHRETKYSCPVGVNMGGNSEISDTKNREGSSSGPPNYILGSAIPEACSELPKPHHLFQIPRAVAVASSAVENPLISFVPSSTEQQPIAATNPGKKRRKN
ncbi:hypothetical protein EUGRSUZ_J01547 [Eucalyptus grandis]|uniref:DRBM domain-containing protein n=2 Tax=Eucalyptus grandis TaxID=71139 RepID=A0A059ADF0_EUCGR|nr:hypothetical protein EUGRSUZ_J01547 [Eucalyptus grandis]